MAALLSMTAALLLGSLCRDHVELVDFLSFAGRALRIRDGVDLVHPLYPVGYPATLSALTVVTQDVLVAGKALAVLSGAYLVYAIARALGAPAALWVLAQGAVLEFGSTEGTDLPAASLAIGALLAAARQRPVWAGVLLGGACMTRFPSVGAIPIALALSNQKKRLTTALVLTTSPHWAIALATGASVLPDQTENLRIAAGHDTTLWSLETARRWPRGFLHAASVALREPATILGATGLLVGLYQRDRRAFALAGLSLMHIALIGLAFAKPRLMLPATIAMAAGVVFLFPRRWPRANWFWGFAAVPVALGALTALWPTTSVDTRRSAQAAALRPYNEPFLTSDPWVAVHRDGWLQAGLPLRETGEASGLTPQALAYSGRARGVHLLLVDRARINRTYPGLTPLLDQDTLNGMTLVEAGTGWRLWRIHTD